MGVTDSTDACHRAALRLLSYHWRSTRELRDKLAEKGYDAPAIRETLERLVEEKWLDDERFARELARSRFRKGIGKLRIVRELSELGISDSMAKAAIAEAVGDEPEEEHLAAAFRKRVRILSRRLGEGFVETEDGRNKLISYLLKQGYEYGAITALLEKKA